MFFFMHIGLLWLFLYSILLYDKMEANLRIGIYGGSIWHSQLRKKH